MKRVKYLCVVTVLVLSPALVAALEPEVVEFVFESAPFASAHASTIVETRDGLVAAWFGGTREGASDVGIWLSRRVNGKWTAPVEVATGVQPDGTRYPTWNPVLFELRQGELTLFYKVGPTPRGWWGMVRTSRDGGRTWSDADRLPDGILGPIKNKPVRLSDGTILAPSSTETPETPSTWRVHFERSGDGGKTWQVARPPSSTGDGTPIEAIQPSILLHADGRLQAIGRTRSGRVFETWSADRGQMWTPVVPDGTAQSQRRYRCRDAEGRPSSSRLQSHPSGKNAAEYRGHARRQNLGSRTRSGNRARRIFVSGGDPELGRPRAHHLHVETPADQTCGHRSGEAENRGTVKV